MRWAPVLFLVVLGAGACKKEKQLSGVGPWNVNRTTLKDATGRCIPEDLGDGREGRYCFGQKPMGIRGMVVDLDLYFAGGDPDDKLVEIQMKVGGCQDDQLFAWMKTNFGTPAEERGAYKLWKNTFLYAVGVMPIADEPGRCVVRLIPVRESDRFERAWKP